jgi:hypothetical protein
LAHHNGQGGLLLVAAPKGGDGRIINTLCWMWWTIVEIHIHGVGEDVIIIKMACTLHFG